MRHLHFTQSLEPLQGGGLGRAALDLHLQFLKDGVVSRLLATRALDFDMVWPEASQYPREGPDKAFYAPSMWSEAGDAIENSDVFHGHGFYVYPNWAVGSRVITKRKPLVYHPHGFFEPWILQRSRLKKRLVSLLFEHRNMGHCRLWRALTAKEADQIRRQGFKAPIVVAPNGVRLEDFDAALPTGGASPWTLPARMQGRKRLVFMGRLHPKKGLNLLLPAWAKLKEHHANWELLIAGPDEAGYRATVESMIRELDVASATTLVGPVTGTAKTEFLKSAGLFILPSYSEGFPVAVLEAMACRAPVIGTHACNLAELETEGGGWLCQADLGSLQKALDEALRSSDAERQERGRTARQLIERRYTWPRIAATIREACQCHCT